MDKARKKNIKRVIALVCAAAVVVFLAAMPLIAGQDRQEDGPQASILSGTVATGSIQTELIGGGALAQEDAAVIQVPSAVKLTKFLVGNGETVTEGTPLASVDRVSVMQAITQVQETLDHLSGQIEEAGETRDKENVTALAGGTVKILYAEEGKSVQSIMLEHGSLAVLSLDGLMAVDMQTEADLAVGTAVTVTLSDGTQAEGKISRNLAGEMTVTVEDEGYPVADPVTVTAEDGTAIGSGELYIYSPWNATAYAGTVDTVKVSVGDELSAGKTLMVLTDVGYSAAYRQLISQRQEYEELMLELFEMYQTQTVTAPCDGMVSGIDAESLQLLSGNDQGFVLTLLANAPNGDDETLYANYLGQVTAIAPEGWYLNIDPQAVSVEDYLALTGLTPDPAAMTQAVLHTQTDIPVYALAEGAWTQLDSSEVAVGDILLFAADGSGSLIWSVRIATAPQQEEPTEPSAPTEPAEPTVPSDPTEPTVPSEPMEPTIPSDPTEPTVPSQPGGSTVPGEPGTNGGTAAPGGQTGNMTPGFTYPSGGSFGSGGSWGGTGGMIEQEPAFELYSLDMVQIAAVTPQDTMTLDITVDELDIRALAPGMTAQVKIDALGGEKYTAVITGIGNTGANNGGSSKYTVELTMDRSGSMLPGMNATATIVLATAADVLTIPADALAEQGLETVVYTGYDQENEVLLDPVTVKIGSSDGETVEVLEGLESGQTYYYAYYDTLEISFTPDFGGGGFPFG